MKHDNEPMLLSGIIRPSVPLGEIVSGAIQSYTPTPFSTIRSRQICQNKVMASWISSSWMQLAFSINIKTSAVPNKLAECTVWGRSKWWRPMGSGMGGHQAPWVMFLWGKVSVQDPSVRKGSSKMLLCPASRPSPMKTSWALCTTSTWLPVAQFMSHSWLQCKSPKKMLLLDSLKLFRVLFSNAFEILFHLLHGGFSSLFSLVLFWFCAVFWRSSCIFLFVFCLDYWFFK